MKNGENVKAELDLSNYVKKADLKGTAEIDTINLFAESALASVKSEVDKIDIETKSCSC